MVSVLTWVYEFLFCQMETTLEDIPADARMRKTERNLATLRCRLTVLPTIAPIVHMYLKRPISRHIHTFKIHKSLQNFQKFKIDEEAENNDDAKTNEPHKESNDNEVDKTEPVEATKIILQTNIQVKNLSFAKKII